LLSEGYVIGVAAEKIGVARSTAYSWRSDPEFLVRWNDAVGTSLDRVETAMVKRAIKRSDTNAQFIMSKRRSEIYGKHDTSPTNGEREQRTLEDLETKAAARGGGAPQGHSPRPRNAGRGLHPDPR